VQQWHARRGSFTWALARLSAGVALGAAPGALYAGLVAAVRLAVYGNWDPSPTFSMASVLIGAVVGLAGGIVSALSEDAEAVELPAARSTMPRVLVAEPAGQKPPRFRLRPVVPRTERLRRAIESLN
jgi:hypothetical protein